MHIAHVHLCLVQKCRCLPCNMVRDVIVLLLNHALGVRAELFRERGKRAFRGGGGGLHYGKTRRPGPLFHSSGESWKTPCISNEWFYVSVLRGPTSISWIQANILCLTDCDFHSRVHRWLLQGYEGIMSVFFCYLCILSLSLFVILFVWLLFMFWVEVKSPRRPDPWVETRLSLSPMNMMIFRLHQVYSFQIIVQKGNFTSDNTVKHWETLWFIVAIVQRPPPVLSPPPWLGLPSGPALICTTSL